MLFIILMLFISYSNCKIKSSFLIHENFRLKSDSNSIKNSQAQGDVKNEAVKTLLGIPIKYKGEIISKDFDAYFDEKFYEIILRENRLLVLSKNTSSFQEELPYTKCFPLVYGQDSDYDIDYYKIFNNIDGKFNLNLLYKIEGDIKKCKLSPILNDENLIINIPKYIINKKIILHYDQEDKYFVYNLSETLNILRELNIVEDYDLFQSLFIAVEKDKNYHANMMIINKRGKNITFNLLDSKTINASLVIYSDFYRDIKNFFVDFDEDINFSFNRIECNLQKDSYNCSYYSFNFMYNYLYESLYLDSAETLKIICIEDNPYDIEYPYLNPDQRNHLIILQLLDLFYENISVKLNSYFMENPSYSIEDLSIYLQRFKDRYSDKLIYKY